MYGACRTIGPPTKKPLLTAWTTRRRAGGRTRKLAGDWHVTRLRALGDLELLA